MAFTLTVTGLQAETMTDISTQATEDYLKAIYELCADHDRASTGRIAAMLGITPASVTGMLQKLAQEEPPLLHYRKRRGAILTPAGKEMALKTIRQHRLLERFLHDELGYSWDEVHEEAERLEHVISDELEERLVQLLDDPQHDPHGAPIPARDLSVPGTVSTRLGELEAGQRATVRRVYDRDPELLRRLARLGLTLGATFTVLPPEPSQDGLRLQLSGEDASLFVGEDVTGHVYVEILVDEDGASVGETPAEVL